MITFKPGTFSKSDLIAYLGSALLGFALAGLIYLVVL